MFPICNDQGKVIAFTGTNAVHGRQGWTEIPELAGDAHLSKSRVLFNSTRPKKPCGKLDYVILVEGQMDCISVYNAGFHNVIASSGTAFTEIQVAARPLCQENRRKFRSGYRRRDAAEKRSALLVAEDFESACSRWNKDSTPISIFARKGVDAYAALSVGRSDISIT